MSVYGLRRVLTCETVLILSWSAGVRICVLSIERTNMRTLSPPCFFVFSYIYTYIYIYIYIYIYLQQENCDITRAELQKLLEYTVQN